MESEEQADGMKPDYGRERRGARFGTDQPVQLQSGGRDHSQRTKDNGDSATAYLSIYPDLLPAECSVCLGPRTHSFETQKANEIK